MSQTTTEMVYHKLKQQLVGGNHQPGKRISRSRIARQLGCSAIPVLEAMRLLQSEGLLVKESRKMARVRKLSPQEIEGLYLVREGFETVTARLCAQRITPAQIQRLEQLGHNYEQAIEIQDRQAAGDVDVAIHKLIAEAANCPLLADELARLLVIERTASQTWSSLPLSETLRNSHRALLQAIHDHDIDSAEYLMKKHIQNGYREYVSALPEPADRGSDRLAN